MAKKKWLTVGFLLLALLTFSIYCLIIILLETQPASDFYYYYKTALELQHGSKLQAYYQYFQAPGYPFLLSTIFTFLKTQSVLGPQIMNAFILSILAFSIARYGFLMTRHLAILAFSIVAFNLNYFSMVSILCSEIPYAFFFMVGFLIFWNGFKSPWDEDIIWRIKPQLVFMGAGVSLGVSQVIRPTTTPFLILMSILFFLGFRIMTIDGRKIPLKEAFSRAAKILLPVWIAFMITVLSLYWAAGYGLTFQPLQNGLWNLYVGFNIESRGKWNEKDAKIFEIFEKEHKWDAEIINKSFKPLVLERIRHNWGNLIFIYPYKLYTLLNPRSILWWSVDHSRFKQKEMIYGVANYLLLINLIVFSVSIGALLLWLGIRNISKDEFFCFCILGTAFLNLVLHGYFLEVQPRYANHLWLTLFWCFPVGVCSLRDNFKK
jgi:hypothetical protein